MQRRRATGASILYPGGRLETHVRQRIQHQRCRKLLIAHAAIKVPDVDSIDILCLHLCRCQCLDRGHAYQLFERLLEFTEACVPTGANDISTHGTNSLAGNAIEPLAQLGFKDLAVGILGQVSEEVV
ncbi:hypothetical protein HORIV_38610 [Vreelandella olivaria]|uniref:Uncharacterized protein n=1 Tax=Vreelandella olivaria TaxID=390919 RepID=A0ABM7GL55_9GAMM|nr:hypothetical protein HORIV_38610 [Halomonas olivaria]